MNYGFRAEQYACNCFKLVRCTNEKVLNITAWRIRKLTYNWKQTRVSNQLEMNLHYRFIRLRQRVPVSRAYRLKMLNGNSWNTEPSSYCFLLHKKFAGHYYRTYHGTINPPGSERGECWIYNSQNKERIFETHIFAVFAHSVWFLSCSRLSVRGNDRKSERATSGDWNRKGDLSFSSTDRIPFVPDPARRSPAFLIVPTDRERGRGLLILDAVFNGKRSKFWSNLICWLVSCFVDILSYQEPITRSFHLPHWMIPASPHGEFSSTEFVPKNSS